jgi:hypothetical protein
MVNGYFDNYFTFEEYNDLTTDEEKQEYLKDIDETLTGYYRTTTDSAFKSLYEVNDTTGILHGIHAYSAILALVGTIFGMSNMMYTGALFMFCVLCILYTILSLYLQEEIAEKCGKPAEIFRPVLIMVRIRLFPLQIPNCFLHLLILFSQQGGCICMLLLFLLRHVLPKNSSEEIRVYKGNEGHPKQE